MTTTTARLRGAIAIVLVATASLTSAAGARAPSSVDELRGLTIAPEVESGYDRDKFRHWIDADGDGCDTRREVLIAESTRPVRVGAGCSIANGRWLSAYDGRITTDASTFDIDHVVALKEAWDSGANTWSNDRRRAFANDLTDAFALIAVSASSNRSKGDKDPADWLPSRTAYRCTYVRDWVRVKKVWKLSVDQREYDALARVLARC